MSKFHRLLLFLLLEATLVAAADPIPVRYPQGTSRGFLVLKTLEGKVIAAGDLYQTVQGSRITARLVFHFRDGSIDDDVTVYSQQKVFRLISDHHIQRGPSFPKPVDLMVDVPSGTLTSRSVDSDGKPKSTTEHLDLSSDVSNGLVSTAVENIPFNAPQTSLSYVASSGSKGRQIHLNIKPVQLVPVVIDGRKFKAMEFNIKIDLGGVAGVVAPVIGKQPHDVRFWILAGPVPAVLAEESQLYLDGPVWRIELSRPEWPRHP